MKTNKIRFVAALPLLAVGLALVPGTGCGDDITNPAAGLCCTDFQVGADLKGADFGVDASVAGQFQVFAQAAADVGAIASAAISDVELACRNLSTDFGASEEQLATIKATADQNARVKAYCELAVASIEGSFTAGGKFEAAGKLSVVVTPPKCEASVSASADCSASCSVSGECDAKATPPTCEGGKMEVSCSGGCKGEAGASISCKGSCSAECKGACTATGGVSVACEGKCEGTCEADAAGGGTGVQADGSCDGKCQGTCTAKADAPAVKCEGSCDGECTGECKAEAGASVKCDGKCEGTAEPISCKGGELKASCEVDANCDANCSASASAKASCTPPAIDIAFTGGATLDASIAADFKTAVDSLKANLAIIFGVKAKAEGAVTIVGKIAGNISGSGAAFVDPGKLGLKGSACLLGIVGAFATAGKQLTGSIEASASIVASFGG